jgi:hypothetical protein
MLLSAFFFVGTGCAGVKSSTDGGAASGTSQGSTSLAPPRADQVRLVVSQDYGETVSHDVVVPFEDGLTVLQLLAEQADVETGYGGGFVTAVDGLESTFGDSDDAADWFYWVDGRMGRTGAADLTLRAGQTVWWDFHRWQGAMFIPVVIEAFPRPWGEGGVALAGSVAGAAIADWAEGCDIMVDARVGLDRAPTRSAIVAATPAHVGTATWLNELLAQRNDVGVFVEVRGGVLWALNHRGRPTVQVAAAMVAAPSPAAEQESLLMLLGADQSSLERLIKLVGSRPADSAHVGVALLGDELLPLPDER